MKSNFEICGLAHSTPGIYGVSKLVSRSTALAPQSEDCSARSETLGARRKKRRLLPSPSTTGSFGKQQGQAPRLQNLDTPHTSKEAQVVPESSDRRTTDKNTRSVGEPSSLRHKRKRTDTEAVENSIERQFCESAAKRTKATSRNDPATSYTGRDRDDCHLIEYWASTGYWPEAFSKMSQDQSDSSRRRRRESSYTQSIKDGDVPKAHARALKTQNVILNKVLLYINIRFSIRRKTD
ncbi:MAG: hypothetical protein Q9225_001764 [Loekoesia sp. 1 TL-2023]